MFNLLKADLYRLFKTKSYYIVGIILGLFCVMMMYTYGDMIKNGYAAELGFDPSNIGFIDLVYNVLYNTLIVMIIGIEAAVFICADFNSGYIKNIASSVNRKSMIAISKFITLTIGTLFYFVIMILITYISSNLFINNVMVGDIGILLKYVGMVLFLTLVMIGLVVLVSNLFRNSAASITTLILVIVLSSLVYMLIKQFFNIDLSSISPIMNYQILTPFDTSGWLDMILSGLAFMGVYLVGSAVLMEKKDIT